MIPKPQLPVPDFLLEIAREVLVENDLPEKARARTSVTLRRRFRAATPSDLLGRFEYGRTDGNSTWLGDGPEQELIMNMYGFHVVKPAIRANQSAMMQARVECTVKPNSKNPSLAGVASIGTGIYKYINNHPDYWSNNLESQVNQQVQTDYGCFIHTYHDPEAESPINITVDEYSDQPVEQAGEYACAYCASGGPMFSEQMGQAADGQMPCLNDECQTHNPSHPHFGGLAEIIKMPSVSEEPFLVGKSEHPAGNIVQEAVSAFQVRVDERKTKNGKLRKATYLEHHSLWYEDDLQALVPYFELNAPTEWSYPIKWEYALETGTDFFLKPWTAGGTDSRRAQHEVRKIYLRPGRYRHYVAPADFTLDRGDHQAATNRQGQPMLSIKKGERLIDYFPKGFWFIVANGQLLPAMEPCDLRDEWAYMGFLNDSASFWAQPAVELNELQRVANNLYTIEMQHLETSSIVTNHYDREAFDSDDFERGLSPTKEGFHLAPGDTLRNHLETTTPPNLSGVMQGMEFVRSLIPDVSGVQPAMIGAEQGDAPYAAQRMQRQQSLGLLTPSQQSKAECKATVTFQHLKWAQRTKPIEWFRHVGTIYGEEWKDQDIEAFCNANLELDITVGYKEGSETPSSLIEQEMKNRQFMLDVAQVAQFIPGLVSPEMVKEIMSKYSVAAGLDLDFDNVVADQRLAGSRYLKIKLWLDANRNREMPEEALVELAIADRSLKPTSGEDNDTHIEFYEDHVRALMAEEDPDYPLISCCVEMINRHNENTKDQKQTESEIEVEGHAPEIAAQVAAQEAQAKAEAQAQAEKDQREAAARAQDNQAATERQAMTLTAKAQEAEKKRAHDAEENEAERHLRAVEIGANASKDSGGAPEAPFDPLESIAASMDYSELPVSAQQSMLDRVGLPKIGVREVHEATIKNAQIAATKLRASQSRSNGTSK